MEALFIKVVQYLHNFNHVFVFSTGLITCVMPMYLTELAPTALRGSMGVMCPLGITFGVLLGQITSMSQLLGTLATKNFIFKFCNKFPEFRNQRCLAVLLVYLCSIRPPLCHCYSTFT